jgi:mannose-1-phosphate guanylyltransferase
VANSYLHEETELGTAGGLYKFREQILADGPESIFVLHCDIACPFPLKEMLAFHREKVRELGIVGTLLGSKVHYSADTTRHDTTRVKACSTRVLSRSTPSTPTTTAVWWRTTSTGCSTTPVRRKNSRLIAPAPLTFASLLCCVVTEKPSTHVSDLINSGVYCFSPKIFDTIKDTAARLQSENSDLPAYLYPTHPPIRPPSSAEALVSIRSGAYLPNTFLGATCGESTRSR